MGKLIASTQPFVLYTMTPEQFYRIVNDEVERLLLGGWGRFMIVGRPKRDDESGRPRIGISYNFEQAGRHCPISLVESVLAKINQAYEAIERRQLLAVHEARIARRRRAVRNIARFDRLISGVRNGDADALSGARSIIHQAADAAVPESVAAALAALRDAAMTTIEMPDEVFV